MKKKTIAGIIATTMVLSLAGCSSSASSSTTDESIEISASEENPEEEPIEAELDEDADSKAPAYESIDNSDLQDDQFRYDGKVVSILDDVNTLVETINDSNPEEYEGQTFYYTEDKAIYLETLDKDGSELPICLTINDYGIATNHNISIGSFRDDVIAAYGEPNVEPSAVYGPDGNELSKEEVIELCGEELIYDLGDITITFIVTDGFVSSITYTHNANHDKFSWS